MNILNIFYQILMMLMIAAIGLLLRRKNVIDVPLIKGINSLVLKVAMPALAIMVTQKEVGDEALRASFLRILPIALLIIGMTGLLAYVFARRKLPEKRVAAFAALAAMPNVGYMGVPIAQAVYGDQGTLLLGAYLIGFNTLMFTLFQGMYAGSSYKARELIRNPGLIACVIALLLFLLRIRLPVPLNALFTQLGSITTPLSMLLAGARLAEFRWDFLKERSLWSVVGLRLLGIPLAVTLILQVLGFRGMELGVLVLGTSMPCAVGAQMLAERYDKDTVFAATGISVSLLLCLASIPLLMAIAGM
jgi:predicted permease